MNRLAVLRVFAPLPLHAVDTPAFDWPGIAFPTTTIPRGGVSCEQGLPHFASASDDGLRTRSCSAATNAPHASRVAARIAIAC
jgi:hypothetical protein